MPDDTLLSILRCPATRQKLRPATADEKSSNHLPLEEPALITEDGSRIYGSGNGMLILLANVERADTSDVDL